MVCLSVITVVFLTFLRLRLVLPSQRFSRVLIVMILTNYGPEVCRCASIIVSEQWSQRCGCMLLDVYRYNGFKGVSVPYYI